MKLEKVLALESCRVAQNCQNREEVLDAIAKILASRYDLPAPQIYSMMLQREKENSTGFTDGVAIPHCSHPGFGEFQIGAMNLESGIDYNSMDGQPTRTFLFFAGPPDDRTRHIRILAAITKMLRKKEVLASIQKSESSSELRNLLLNQLSDLSDEANKGPHGMLILYIDNHELMQPALEILSSEPECAIAITEAEPPGAYLNKTPLFASFWEENKSIHRVEAILPGSTINHVVRQLSDLAHAQSGLQVNVVDLHHSTGKIEL